MTITVAWKDHTRTVIQCDLEGKWGWQDFHRAVAECRNLLEDVKHSVHIVVDTLESAGLPRSSPLQHFRKAFAHGAANVGMIVVVTQMKFAKLAIGMTCKFYNVENRVSVVATKEDAASILTEHLEEQILKDRLIYRIGSGHRSIARQAINEMRERDWLYDGSLHGAGLSTANLQEANLSMADLYRARLVMANLVHANLFLVNLEAANMRAANCYGASMVEANLERANLHDVNFQDADLAGSNLQRANLKRSNLCGANLYEALLAGANLRGTFFDSETILPDGHRWTPETEMAIFVDPAYVNYWYGNGEDETLPERPADIDFQSLLRAESHFKQQ